MPGFKFNGKDCVAMEGNASASSGCYVGNYINNKCLICNNTHYMNEDGQCMPIATDVEEVKGLARQIIYLALLWLF